jgi:hypothetical protein
MVALAVLAAAAAVVSWDAQYVMVSQVKHTPAIAALEAAVPDVGAVIFAAAWHRAGTARPPSAAAADTERRLRGDLAGHERDGRQARLAGYGDLGHARCGLCFG